MYNPMSFNAGTAEANISEVGNITIYPFITVLSPNVRGEVYKIEIFDTIIPIRWATNGLDSTRRLLSVFMMIHVQLR